MCPDAAHLSGNVPAYSIRIEANSRNLAAVLDADDVGAIARSDVTLHIQVFVGLPFEGCILQRNLATPLDYAQ